MRAVGAFVPGESGWSGTAVATTGGIAAGGTSAVAVEGTSGTAPDWAGCRGSWTAPSVGVAAGAPRGVECPAERADCGAG